MPLPPLWEEGAALLGIVGAFAELQTQPVTSSPRTRPIWPGRALLGSTTPRRTRLATGEAEAATKHAAKADEAEGTAEDAEAEESKDA
ncbi:hypothetical protein [Streptomyces lincolnensis]|uniref:hypothetical protein n=1 Tax=Streptomyces lincolnensis TaxID=1915 RepID=UPI0013520891|nr:hypothetical protein [Streptomyces lincolnensis]QMV04327.1 hypothetical protein GJU35_00560 [Streptomyces lincolnensis]QMV11996.1 hypothetical protein GJU35_44360 [Streptomyces lincolnensis]